MGDNVKGTRLANGLTVDQERFAQELAKGKSQAEAFRSIKDVSRWADGPVYAKASTWAAEPKIRERVQELVTQSAKVAMINREFILSELVDTAVAVEPKDRKQHHVNCFHLLGKETGEMFKEQGTVVFESRSEKELEAQLSDLQRQLDDLKLEENQGDFTHNVQDNALETDEKPVTH